jgi:multidrug efflux pump subunit AcrA (membrane-fusion protein)
MIDRLIEVALKNRFIVIALYLGLAGWGWWALRTTPIDAIPDLSDNQVIVFTDWSGHSPQEVEDQITYPLTTNLQGLAGIRGQPVAQVYSPELAEARTRFVAAKAMLDAHDRELQRTQKLADIGAASRQELERIHAEHAAQLADVESARSRLQLLGADPDEATPNAEASATVTVPSPIDGVVTERLANPGLNVDPATRLLTIVDLANVWVIGDVYERDRIASGRALELR